MYTLNNLKMLLGITTVDEDTLLEFILDKINQYVCYEMDIDKMTLAIEPIALDMAFIYYNNLKTKTVASVEDNVTVNMATMSPSISNRLYDAVK